MGSAYVNSIILQSAVQYMAFRLQLTDRPTDWLSDWLTYFRKPPEANTIDRDEKAPYTRLKIRTENPDWLLNQNKALKISGITKINFQTRQKIISV